MKFKVNKKTTFGTIDIFDQYELNFVNRNSFIEPPSRLKLKESQIPKDGEFANTNPVTVQMSKYFTDKNLMKFPVNPVLTSVSGSSVLVDGEIVTSLRKKNHYSNKFVYDNLQRLCFEVLDPVVDFAGVRPTILNGLLFTENTKGIDQDSFFAEQTKGNAVVFNFPNESDNKIVNKVFLYISEFSIFDTLIYDNKNYDIPTIKVSVNDRKRRMLFKVRG